MTTKSPHYDEKNSLVMALRKGDFKPKEGSATEKVYQLFLWALKKYPGHAFSAEDACFAIDGDKTPRSVEGYKSRIGQARSKLQADGYPSGSFKNKVHVKGRLAGFRLLTDANEAGERDMASKNKRVESALLAQSRSLANVKKMGRITSSVAKEEIQMAEKMQGVAGIASPALAGKVAALLTNGEGGGK